MIKYHRYMYVKTDRYIVQNTKCLVLYVRTYRSTSYLRQSYAHDKIIIKDIATYYISDDSISLTNAYY